MDGGANDYGTEDWQDTERLPQPGAPAKAGVQKELKRLDSRLRGNDNEDLKKIFRNQPDDYATTKL